MITTIAGRTLRPVFIKSLVLRCIHHMRNAINAAGESEGVPWAFVLDEQKKLTCRAEIGKQREGEK